MKRVSIFLITVALIAGMVGCGEVTPPSRYNLTMAVVPSGSGTATDLTNASPYAAGSLVRIKAVANPAYYFVNWTASAGEFTDTDGAETTFTMPSQDVTITANFKAAPPIQYSLTVHSTTGGSVTTPGQGTFPYDAGTAVNLVAKAEEGYGFTEWTGDVSTIADVNSASTTITMNGDYTISADFGVGIYDWYDLNAIRDNLGGSYILMNDLDSSTAGYAELAGPTGNGGKGWEPIGTYESGPPEGAFSGNLDGRGYEIRNLFIDRPSEYHVGLFGAVSWGGVIKNVCMVGVDVTGGANVGSLAGVLANRTVGNSWSTGSVSGQWGVGGLVGQNVWGTIKDSYFVGSITANGGVAGGLTGMIYGGTVSNSYYDYDEVLINGQHIITLGALFPEDFEQWLANGRLLDVNERLCQEDGYYVINDVGDFKELLAFGQDDSLRFRLNIDLDLTTEPDFYIPYLAGEFDGNGHRIVNLSLQLHKSSPLGLFAYLAPGGNVTRVGAENTNITGYADVGSLVGCAYPGSTVSNSYSTGSVTGGWRVGGLVGSIVSSHVVDSYSSGSVTGNDNAGGLIGGNYWGDLSKSYSTAQVAGFSQIGGLVGVNNDGTVSDSYSTGSVTGSSRVGGLVGSNYRQSQGTVRNSYSTGSVTGSSEVGGLVGYSTGLMSNSFWNVETSGQATSGGGTGKTTAEIKNVATLSGAGWNITAVALNQTDPAYIWNIVNGVTYPFLSWQSVS